MQSKRHLYETYASTAFAYRCTPLSAETLIPIHDLCRAAGAGNQNIFYTVDLP